MNLPLCFAKSSSLKRIPWHQKQYVFHENIPPKTRKLVTLANCLSSFCPIVLVEVQDIPETFFVRYHQETIVKSSQLL